MKGHIDKLTKNIEFNIDSKPVGAVQWDFICSIPEAADSLIHNYEIGPESIFIYFTKKCSIKCKKCNKNFEENINIEQLRQLFEGQKNKRLNYIVLDGDPLLADNIEEVIDLMIEYKFAYSINTFIPPTDKILEKVKGTISKIQFKMQGLDDKKYTDNIIKGLEICKKYGIYTAIIFSINKKNFNKISEMVEFCKKYNVKQFSFSRLNFCPDYDEKYEFIDGNEYLELSKKLVELRKNEKEIHITSNDAIWKGCGACALTATIYPNGDIYPCAFLKIKCGNINEGFNKAWESEVFKNIRESNLKGKCGKCKYKLLCKGCRAVAYKNHLDYLDEDGGCWL